MFEFSTLSGAWAPLAFGFLLGLKHATDADHVVAVSAIATEHTNAWPGVWIGMSWGLGHTTPLLILGVGILLLKEAVLDWYAGMAPTLEFLVGIMLVLIGAQVFYNLRKGRLHVHSHQHGGQAHIHVHSTHHEENEPRKAPKKRNAWGLRRMGRPTFRAKSYGIGIVHGLAGSAAVMLVLLPQIDTLWSGVGFLVLFGLGTVVSMATITIVLGVPFALTGKAQGLNRTVAGVAGGASLALGAALMSDIALGTTLIPF